jgi:hypothetical protein
MSDDDDVSSGSDIVGWEFAIKLMNIVRPVSAKGPLFLDQFQRDLPVIIQSDWTVEQYEKYRLSVQQASAEQKKKKESVGSESKVREQRDPNSETSKPQSAVSKWPEETKQVIMEDSDDEKDVILVPQAANVGGKEAKVDDAGPVQEGQPSKVAVVAAVAEKVEVPQWEKDGLPIPPPRSLAMAMTRCDRESSIFQRAFVECLMTCIWPVGTNLLIASEHRSKPRSHTMGSVCSGYHVILAWYPTYSNTADAIMVVNFGLEFCLLQFDPSRRQFIYIGGRCDGADLGQAVMIGWSSTHREPVSPSERLIEFEKEVASEVKLLEKQRLKKAAKAKLPASTDVTETSKDVTKTIKDVEEAEETTISNVSGISGIVATAPEDEEWNGARYVMREQWKRSRGTGQVDFDDVEYSRYPFCDTLVQAWDQCLLYAVKRGKLPSKHDPEQMAQRMRDTFWTVGAEFVLRADDFKDRFVVLAHGVDQKLIDKIKADSEAEHKAARKAAIDAARKDAKCEKLKRHRERVAKRRKLDNEGTIAVVREERRLRSRTVPAARVEAKSQLALATSVKGGRKRKRGQAASIDENDDDDNVAESSFDEETPDHELYVRFDHDDGSFMFWIDNINAPNQTYDSWSTKRQILEDFHFELDEFFKKDSVELGKKQSKACKQSQSQQETHARQGGKYHVWVNSVFRRDPCNWCIQVAMFPIK